MIESWTRSSCDVCINNIFRGRQPTDLAYYFVVFLMVLFVFFFYFFFSSRRRHTRLTCDWSSDVYSSDLRHGNNSTSAVRVRTRSGELVDLEVVAGPLLAPAGRIRGAIAIVRNLGRRRAVQRELQVDRKSTRLNSSHMSISYAVFCLKKKK